MQTTSEPIKAFRRMSVADKAAFIATLLNDCDIMDSAEGYALYEAGEAFYASATAETETFTRRDLNAIARANFERGMAA